MTSEKTPDTIDKIQDAMSSSFKQGELFKPVESKWDRIYKQVTDTLRSHLIDPPCDGGISFGTIEDIWNLMRNLDGKEELVFSDYSSLDYDQDFWHPTLSVKCCNCDEAMLPTVNEFYATGSGLYRCPLCELEYGINYRKLGPEKYDRYYEVTIRCQCTDSLSEGCPVMSKIDLRYDASSTSFSCMWCRSTVSVEITEGLK